MKNLFGLKNIFILASITGMLLSGCSSSVSKQSGTANTEAKKTYKVGYTNYFSGKQAAMGKIVDGAVKVALDEVNKDSKVPIELMPEDIGDSPVTAKNGYEALLAKKPPALLTFIASTSFIGVAPLLEKEKMPVVLSNTLGTIFEHGWNWVFGTQTPGSIEAPLAIKYYHEKLGKKKIAVMVSNDDTGKSILNSLKDVAQKNNITIIPVLFNNGDNDFTPNITSARRQNPDMYYVNTVYTADLANMVKQMRQLGIKEPISVNNYIANADFTSLLDPKQAEGIYGYTCAYVRKDNPKVQAFAKKFKEKTGLEADPTSLFVYDAAMVMFRAVEKGNGDKEKILSALHSTQYEGVAGNYKFDSKGRGRTDTNMLQIGPNKTIKFLENVKYTEN